MESFYLITSTISTVGYGDLKGYNDNGGSWIPEMLYLSFVTCCGIVLFSSVTSEIFSYRVPQLVSSIIRMHRNNMEVFMYEISSKIKMKEIPLELIEMCKTHIQAVVLDSTRLHFANNPFYEELPGNLRRKLI